MNTSAATDAASENIRELNAATPRLSDAELHDLFDMVTELHAALRYVQSNAPVLLAALQDHPMFKMLGASKLLGG